MSTASGRLCRPGRLVPPLQVFFWSVQVFYFAVAVPAGSKFIPLVMLSWFAVIAPLFWLADLAMAVGTLAWVPLLVVLGLASLFLQNFFVQATYQGTIREVPANVESEGRADDITRRARKLSYAEFSGGGRFMFGRLFLFSVLLATATFSTLSGVLYQHCWIVPAGPALDPSRLASSFRNGYFWQLAKAVPILEIPETLNWKAPWVMSDPLGGALMLLYKIVVIVPLVQVAALLLKQRSAGSSASGR
jgi:hypothetical protein